MLPTSMKSSWVGLSWKFHQYRSLYTKTVFPVLVRHGLKLIPYTAKPLSYRIKRQSVLAHEQNCPYIKRYQDCMTCFVIARTRMICMDKSECPQVCWSLDTLMTMIAFPTLLPIPFSPYRVVHMVSLSPGKEHF